MNHFLGDGTFGRVLECEDTLNKSIYAIKIIKPVSRYIESAKIESGIINNINRKDTNNKSHCIKVNDSFSFSANGEHYYAIIFEKLGKSLYEFLKDNHFRPFGMNQIQSLARQIFEGIGTLHKMGIIHSDLKPENILFTTSLYHRFKDKNSWPINAVFKEDKQPVLKGEKYSDDEDELLYYNQMDSSEIKIIDFGGAVYTSDSCTGLINTRQYRAPEVILSCCKWDEKTDVWSIACILLELYTGELLFSTHEDKEHLCLIEKVCGLFPNWMVNNCEEEKLYTIFHKSHFSNSFPQNENSLDSYFYFIDLNKIQNPAKIKEALHYQETLDSLILDLHQSFRDFLKFLLIIDPKQRPSCEQALKHPFFDEIFED